MGEMGIGPMAFVVVVMVMLFVVVVVEGCTNITFPCIDVESVYW